MNTKKPTITGRLLWSMAVAFGWALFVACGGTASSDPTDDAEATTTLTSEEAQQIFTANAYRIRLVADTGAFNNDLVTTDDRIVINSAEALLIEYEFDYKGAVIRHRLRHEEPPEESTSTTSQHDLRLPYGEFDVRFSVLVGSSSARGEALDPRTVNLTAFGQDIEFTVADNRHSFTLRIRHEGWAYRATIGESGVTGNGNNQFDSPTDVKQHPNGDVYVVDGTVNSRVQVFRPSVNGRQITYNYVRTIEVTNADGAAMEPRYLDFDPDGDYLFLVRGRRGSDGPLEHRYGDYILIYDISQTTPTFVRELRITNWAAQISAWGPNPNFRLDNQSQVDARIAQAHLTDVNYRTENGTNFLYVVDRAGADKSAIYKIRFPDPDTSLSPRPYREVLEADDFTLVEDLMRKPGYNFLTDVGESVFRIKFDERGNFYETKSKENAHYLTYRRPDGSLIKLINFERRRLSDEEDAMHRDPAVYAPNRYRPIPQGLKHLAIDKYGRIYTTHSTFGQVQVYDGDTQEHLFSIGKKFDFGTGNDQIQYDPSGMDFDPIGRAFVVDKINERVQIYDIAPPPTSSR